MPSSTELQTQLSHLVEIKQNRVTSDALLRDQKVLIIEHGDKQYQLRHTRQGKLILTL